MVSAPRDDNRKVGLVAASDVDQSAVVIEADPVTKSIKVSIAADEVGIGGSSITGIGDGITTVSTAGTDVALASSTSCKRVSIQAQTDNTGLIAVGTSGVDATVVSGTGIILYPGDVFELDIDNLADIYIDATVNGEGVRYTYFT